MRTYPTPNYRVGRGGASVRRVVLHSTVGAAIGTIDWFSRPESGVSAHYLVALDGTVVRFVDDADTALHCGRVVDPSIDLLPDEDSNATAIGVEFEDGGEPWSERPAALYDAGGALLALLAQRHSLPLDPAHFVRHSELTADTECPAGLDVERLLGIAASVLLATGRGAGA